MIVMEFEIDQDLYDKVNDVLAPQGLTLSDAIVLLFKETTELGRIPFPFTGEELEAAKRSNGVRLINEYIEDNKNDMRDTEVKYNRFPSEKHINITDTNIE